MRRGITTPRFTTFQISVGCWPHPFFAPSTPAPHAALRGPGEDMEVDEEEEARKEAAAAGAAPKPAQPAKGPSQLKPKSGLLSEQLADPEAEQIRKGLTALFAGAGPDVTRRLQPLAESALASCFSHLAEKRSNQHKLDAQHLERAADKGGPSEVLQLLATLAKPPPEAGAQPADAQPPASLMQGLAATLAPFLAGGGRQQTADGSRPLCSAGPQTAALEANSHASQLQAAPRVA